MYLTTVFCFPQRPKVNYQVAKAAGDTVPALAAPAMLPAAAPAAPVPAPIREEKAGVTLEENMD